MFVIHTIQIGPLSIVDETIQGPYKTKVAWEEICKKCVKVELSHIIEAHLAPTLGS